VFQDDTGKPWVLPVVRETEFAILSDPNTNHEYLPALGSEAANKAAVELLLGDCAATREGRAFGVQSLGGTGPIRVGAEFLQQHVGCRVGRYSDPTWINHRDIFVKSGFTDVTSYPYWNSATRAPDFQSLFECLESSPPYTVFLLHAQAQNPTGVDPTREQWRKICQIMKRRNLIPFFDCAYQGWASGDMDEDAWAVRHFEESGLEMLVSQSFGKNLGLYGDRIGFLTFIVKDQSKIEAMKSQLTLILRPMYGNPCRPAARLIEEVLLNKKRREEWSTQLMSMVNRIQGVRKDLRAMLEQLEPGKDWSSITTQVGMFWYSGLTRAQGMKLAEQHVYMMPGNGRMSLCGINSGNIRYFAETVARVTRETS
jgi:aspartate aminotransferase